MIVWSRREDSTQGRLSVLLVRHFMFHDFFTLTYHLMEDKELGLDHLIHAQYLRGTATQKDSSAWRLGRTRHSASKS